MRRLLNLFLLYTILCACSLKAQVSNLKKLKTYYGTASFYADRFAGRKTAAGDSYDPKKFTAACNVIPLGTWVRVTNLRNSKSVVVRINDKLHARTNRLVDLSRAGAQRLGYTDKGLTKVKVEVLGRQNQKYSGTTFL